ncbi:MAG: phenylacetate--CoA ligase family protein, partial [Betaproteobacteria bacterium]
MAALPAQLRAAAAQPALAATLAGIDPDAVTHRAALARVPVTRKHTLLERQQAAREAGPGGAHDPFGGFSAIGWRATGAVRRARRVYQSPGPIDEPEGDRADYWRSARALQAAGFEAGDLVHNSFSYHLTPGAWILEGGA